MKTTQRLYDPGQSVSLDSITRDLRSRGTLKDHIDELSVTYPANTIRIDGQEEQLCAPVSQR